MKTPGGRETVAYSTPTFNNVVFYFITCYVKSGSLDLY